jgi:16S rRNA (uracil1498-N3)-methyltransferase
VRQFFLDTDAAAPPAPGDTVTLDAEESHHLSTVLRGGRDEVLNLVDGRGHRLTGVAAGKRGGCAEVMVQTVQDDPLETSPPTLVLACAVVKGKRFEWALEKAVELGAHRIMPLRCEHGVIDPREGKQSRWVTIMKSAVKQCGRSWLPQLDAPRSVSAALGDSAGTMWLFGAAPWELATPAVQPWEDLLTVPAAPVPPTLGILVGPEGGWSPLELAQLGRGALPVSLGPHVLRAETAVAAGLTALQVLRRAWNPALRPPAA